jgi:hypothetical protein
MTPNSLVGPTAIEDLCAIASSGPEGCFVELGVYKGGSAWHLAQVARDQGRKLYLYDTFCGIPFKAPIDHHAPGDFGDTSVEEVREAIPDAIICEGVFPQTLVPMRRLRSRTSMRTSTRASRTRLPCSFRSWPVERASCSTTTSASMARTKP